MHSDQILKRVELLASQSRFKEARDLLYQFLDQDPTNPFGQYLLGVVLLELNETEKSKQIFHRLISEDPSNPKYLEMLARIDMSQSLYIDAEEKMKSLIAQDPDNNEYFSILAVIKFQQRNYDKALALCEKALEIEPEDLTSLNLKTLISSMLGHSTDAKQASTDALQTDPNNPFTIANHAYSLLHDGQVTEALDRARYALTIDPNNEQAKYVLSEAMKSRFWPYRMYFLYQKKMATLSQTQMWMVLLAVFFGYRLIRSLAEKNEALKPFLIPITVILALIILSTWIINPLMNLYLLSNPYGKLLLDESDTKSAKLTGISLSLGVIFLIAFLLFNQETLLIAAVFFGLMMIPIGSMYTSQKESIRKRMELLTVAILVIGILGLVILYFSNSYLVLLIALLGLIAFQWIHNAMAIKSAGRKYGD